MRRLALLLLLTPLALAQQAPVELATLDAEPFPELIRPLQGISTTTLHARVSCALTDGAQGIPLTYVITEMPPWATVMVAPAQDQVAAESCDQGWVEATATLTATASDQAPAFHPEPVVVELTAGPPGREQKARASVALSATYFSILDVQLAESIATIPPGGHVDFRVKITNFGNADTRVEPQLVDAGEKLAVSVPGALTLESKQRGGTRVSDDLVFRVAADEEDGFVNRVGLVNVRLESAYATDDSFRGDSSSVSFLVTVRTDAPGSGRDAPLSAWTAVAALLGALLARRTLRP